MSRYAIEKHENKQMASIHVDVQVPYIGYFSSEPTTAGGEELQNELLQINGVVKVTASDQRITINRGGAFTWDELVPQIIKVLQSKLKQFENPEEVVAYAE